MSVRVTAWVLWDSPSTGNDRLVLIAIADEADDEGRNAFPSYDTIARKARIDKRTAMRSVDRLEAGGELLVKRPDRAGRGHHNRYVVVMGRDPGALAGVVGWPPPNLSPAAAAQWCQPDTLSGDVDAAPEAGDNLGTDDEKRREMVTQSDGKGALGVTLPVDPLTPPSSRPLPGDKARAEAAATEDTVAAQRAAMDANAARRADDPPAPRPTRQPADVRAALHPPDPEEREAATG